MAMSPDSASSFPVQAAGSDAALGTAAATGPPGPGGGGHRFNIGDALHDGMTAFRRAPLSFSLFSAALTGLQVLLLPLQERLLVEPGQRLQPLDVMLFLLGFHLSLAVSLWGSQGLVRGAWAALAGQRPSLISLLRWDGKGFARLIRAWALLGVLLLIPLVVLVAAVGFPLLLLAAGASLVVGASIVAGAVGLASLGAFGLLLTYLGVNQQFLAQIALLEGTNGLTTLRRGQKLVDHQWLLLLLLLLIKALLLLLGGLLAFITLGIGWILAWPLVSCITTAAYRQLRQRESAAAADLEGQLNRTG